MKDVPKAEWAKRLLEDQIERLAELRNANPRDPGFKLWRQTTLTVVQRIWPGDLARSERFRRVPFSPTSPHASRAQAKEHYERGCAEAGTYLRALVAEIGAQGLQALPPGAADPRPASLPAELTGPPIRATSSAAPADASDHYEPSPLDPTEPPAPSGPVPGPIDPDLLDALLKSREATGEEPAAELPAAPAPPAPARPAPRGSVPAAPPPAAKPPAPPSPRSDRRALKEMLGFVDESARPAPPAPATPPTPPAGVGERFTPPRPAPSFASFETAKAQPPVEETVDELGADAVDELDEDLIEVEIEEIEELEPIEEPKAASRPPSRSDAPPIEFLGRSAATAAAKPASEPETAAAGTRTPTAMAFTVLAGEVARLGVPEGHRAAARAALLDMARGVDSQSASWDSICQILTICAAYPSLARRAIPLIVPFLDAE